MISKASAQNGLIGLKFPLGFRAARLIDLNGRYIELRGRLSLPRNRRFVLEVADSDSSQLDLLSQIPASSISKVVATNIDLNDENIEPLLRFKECEAIDLSGTDIGDSTLSKLREWRKLNKVTVPSTLITRRGLGDLLKCHSIGFLDISSNQLGAQPFESLRNSSSITYLDASKCRLKDEDIKFLEGLPKLNYLFLNYNRGLSDKCVSSLTTIRELVEIRLAESGITADGLKRLGSLGRLKLIVLRFSEPSLSKTVLRKCLPDRIRIADVTEFFDTPPDFFEPLR
ncbi:MAG: hypothetical protein SFV17_04755 [Candidatus Obscuribacter sp.]|nr:hypothetical protein [Candidatus Obscuribacter sp.]